MAASESDSVMDNRHVQAWSIAVYTSICVLGLVGNLSVIYSVLRGKTKRTLVNVFMSSLAVANILLCLFIIPTFDPVFQMAKSRPLGSIMCHLWPTAYYTIRYASMLTFTSIAVGHYLINVHSLEDTINSKILVMIIVFNWLGSFVISLPFGLFNVLKQFDDVENTRSHVCVPRWPSGFSRQTYLIATTIITTLIPAIATVYCFIAVSLAISHLTTADKATTMADKTRTNRLLLYMTQVFVVCWVPIYVLETASEIPTSMCMEILIRVAHAMAISSTCFIPLYYAWLNK